MGLKKHVTLPNGVQLNYHRIAAVTIVTNSQTVIEVASYTSQAKRREELATTEALARGEDARCDVFVETSYVVAPCGEAATVPGAYRWLKAQPEFEGAEDALEDE